MSTHCLIALFTILITLTPSRKQRNNPPQHGEDAVILVDSSILKSMLDLATNKKWDPAKGLLKVYREIGSCPSAATAIGKMLITKNRDGATTVIKAHQ